MQQKIIEYIEGLFREFNWPKACSGLLILLCTWLAWSYYDQFMSIERMKQANEIESMAAAKLKELPDAQDEVSDERKRWNEQRTRARFELKHALDERYAGWRPVRWVSRVLINGWLFFIPTFFCLIRLVWRWISWRSFAKHAEKRRSSENAESLYDGEPLLSRPLFWFLLFLGAGLIVGIRVTADYEKLAAGSFYWSVAESVPVGHWWASVHELGFGNFATLLLSLWMPVSLGLGFGIIFYRQDRFRAKLAERKKKPET